MKFCKDCKWVRPGYFDRTEIGWDAKCGRKLDPVTGEPDENCRSERQGGFWKPDHCGENARFWEPKS